MTGKKRYRWMLLLLLLAGCTSGGTPATPALPAISTSTPTALPTATLLPSPTPTVLISRPTSTPKATSTPTPTSTPRPTATPSIEQLRAQYPEIALLIYQQGGQQSVVNYARQHGILTDAGEMRAALTLDTEDTAPVVARLQELGVKVISTSGSRIEIAVPFSLLRAQASRPGAILNQLTQLEHVVGLVPPG
ncbi:MAG: hypothetical protein BWY25_01282 [Chloroflexi bacterium ADurb.Bin222]|nr:MAG: hypothetical protein BWY25_01282 [Chloroflexi bacterium ADurb.Bin222]